MTIDNNWFERWLAAWPGHIAAGGPDGEGYAVAILEMFHPEGYWEDIAAGEGASWSGEQGLREMFAMSYEFCPNLLHKPLHTVFDGRRYSIDWRMTGRGGAAFAGFPAHDKPFSIRGVSTGEVDDAGLVISHTDYWSLSEYLVQSGNVSRLPVDTGAA
jgi:hypothetical protein